MAGLRQRAVSGPPRNVAAEIHTIPTMGDRKMEADRTVDQGWSHASSNRQVTTYDVPNSFTMGGTPFECSSDKAGSGRQRHGACVEHRY